jgi:3-phosphoshikimate 1-carboxyvinyltransferase
MRIAPAAAVAGHIGVPGDQAISQRAVLIAAVGEGESRIDGFGRSFETQAAVDVVRALGVAVTDEDVDAVVVRGAGLRGLREPAEPLDCGSSSSLLMLLMGLLAGQDGEFLLSGDESVRGVPVNPPADELRAMGASVETVEGRPPVRVRGAPLRAVGHTLRRAGADPKSALLLAGLYGDGSTAVTETAATHDHTETLLRAAGVRVRRAGRATTVEPAERLRLGAVEIPGDFSSAAPFVVAATLVPGSELTVHGVGLNPLRTALLDVLIRMGARITVFNRRRLGGEHVGDLEVIAAPLIATTVRKAEVPRMLDELPLFALAAAVARGDSVVYGVQGERARDRIESVTNVLRPLGVRIAAGDDGFRVRGVPTRPKGGGVVQSGGDPRIAMLAAVAGLASREGVELVDPESAAVSFPGFFDLLESVTQR